jgi:hypothetical protein
MDPHCGYLLPNSGVYRGPSVGLSLMTELPVEVSLHCKRDRWGTKNTRHLVGCSVLVVENEASVSLEVRELLEAEGANGLHSLDAG